MNNPGIVVLVTNSNYRHRLGEKGDQGAEKEYEKRRRMCESAAQKLGKEVLRDVTLEELEGEEDGGREGGRDGGGRLVTERPSTFSLCLQLTRELWRRWSIEGPGMWCRRYRGPTMQWRHSAVETTRSLES